MKLTRRRLARSVPAAGSAAAALTLGACGAGGRQPAHKEAGPADIRLSVWNDVPDWDAYNNIVKDFTGAHPNLKVTPEQYPGGQHYDKLQTLFASGEAPDVNYFQGWFWQPYALQNLLLPLDALLGRDKSMQRLVPSNYEAQSKLRGKTYLLTADTGPMVVFYNRDLFDRAGVPYPKEGWTVDDLVERARRLTRQEGGQQVWGYQANGGYLRNFPWLRMNGAREWDRVAEPKKSQWDNPNVARELQLQLGDLINRFRVAPPRTGVPAEQNHIQFGFAAMKMEGPWFLPQMWGPKARREGGVPFDVAPMPRGSEQHAVHLQHGHTVNAKTKFQDASWELLKWIAGEQGQRRIAEGGRMCNLAEHNEKIWAPMATRDFGFKNAQAFLQAQKMGSINVVGGVSEAQITRDGGLGDAINDIMDGKATAREALAVAHPKIQALLDQYWAREGGK